MPLRIYIQDRAGGRRIVGGGCTECGAMVDIFMDIAEGDSLRDVPYDELLVGRVFEIEGNRLKLVEE